MKHSPILYFSTKYWLIFQLLCVGCGDKEREIAEISVDDGPMAVNLAGGVFETRSKASFPIVFHLDSTFTQEDRQDVEAAMNEWNNAAGIRLLSLGTIVQPKELTTLEKSQDNFDAGYRDLEWSNRGTGILATTQWIKRSDIEDQQDGSATTDVYLNTKAYFFFNSIKGPAEAPKGIEVVDLTSIMIHQFGHVLGLCHKPKDIDPDSVMKDTLQIGYGKHNSATRRLSANDKKTIRELYGE
jgi:hypothetical protein